jgi:hypothetical protein
VVWGHQRLRELTLRENPGPPGWGLVWWAGSPPITKHINAKRPEVTIVVILYVFRLRKTVYAQKIPKINK